jgi:hypothetical protein
MQKIAYDQQSELQDKSQEYRTQEREKERQYQLEREGYTPMNQEQRSWVSQGQATPAARAGGTMYNPPETRLQEIKDSSGNVLANIVMRGNTAINAFKPGKDSEIVKAGDNIFEYKDGKLKPLFMGESSAKEWKPTTKQEKMAYESWRINATAAAQNKYKNDKVKTSLATDSEGNVTNVIYGKDGKVLETEKLGQIGRKGTTNIFDILNNPQAAKPKESGFKGEGYYEVNGEQVVISSQEEYDRLMGE